MRALALIVNCIGTTACGLMMVLFAIKGEIGPALLESIVASLNAACVLYNLRVGFK